MCVVKRQEQENNAFLVSDAPSPPPNSCHHQDLEDLNSDGVELQTALPWWILGREAGGGRPGL